jgi:hypothetical protein
VIELPETPLEGSLAASIVPVSFVAATVSILASVTAADAIFAAVTAESARSAVTTAPGAIVGFGYVPVRSPPAAPVGVLALARRASLSRTTAQSS